MVSDGVTLRYSEEALEELVWRVHQDGEGGDEVEEEEDLHRYFDIAVTERVNHASTHTAHNKIRKALVTNKVRKPPVANRCVF